jgi:hypothetical protein
MRPTCTRRQCRRGSGSLRCLTVAAAVFAALALASGAFAQEGSSSATPEGEEPAGEPDEEAAQAPSAAETEGPNTEQSLEAGAEGPVDGAQTAQTAEEAAGDTETVDESAGDVWDQFDEWEEEAGESSGGQRAFNFEIGGFVEGLVAPRVVHSDASANEFVANEARFRLNIDAVHEIASARFRGDVFADAVTRSIWFDIRDASIFVRASSWFNMRFGRQVLTWGTGDFLFLNDLFPKDYNSFFIGRADEYLKAPSNSIITTFTIEKVGLDLVWTPIFEPDRFIDGERLSFFNPLGPNPGIIGDRSELTPIGPLDPSQQLKNGTVHGRLYGTIGAYELAAYGYAGFWRQPNALTFEVPGDPASIRLTYARLAVYGASVRGPLGGGLFNVEVAYYDSFKDRSGTDPTIPNSQFRGLAGYERELLPKFQMGLQYYLEYTLHYDELIDAADDLGVPLVVVESEFRHLLTLRLTKLLVLDRLELSLFTFFSPNELDTYIRPRITYKIIDPLAFVVGANLMFGRDDYTFFGQLEQNTNVYVRMRYSF